MAFTNPCSGSAKRWQSREFYTPRPVTKFIVDMVNPQLGEIVLDPAVEPADF